PGHAEHLRLDHVERLSLTLTDLYGQQLQQVPVMVRRGRALALRMVDEAARDVKADRARARRGAGRRVRRPHSRGIDERGGVRREPASVPRRVARVRTEQGDGRVGHPRRITLAPGNFEERARPAGSGYFFGRAFFADFFAFGAGFFALPAF